MLIAMCSRAGVPVGLVLMPWGLGDAVGRLSDGVHPRREDLRTQQVPSNQPRVAVGLRVGKLRGVALRVQDLRQQRLGSRVTCQLEQISLRNPSARLKQSVVDGLQLNDFFGGGQPIQRQEASLVERVTLRIRQQQCIASGHVAATTVPPSRNCSE
jgi:hypothetical protein